MLNCHTLWRRCPPSLPTMRPCSSLRSQLRRHARGPNVTGRSASARAVCEPRRSAANELRDACTLIASNPNDAAEREKGDAVHDVWRPLAVLPIAHRGLTDAEQRCEPSLRAPGLRQPGCKLVPWLGRVGTQTQRLKLLHAAAFSYRKLSGQEDRSFRTLRAKLEEPACVGLG
jgi:hypothetical protein